MKFDREIPTVEITGNAFECGMEYVDFVIEKFPGFTEYLNLVIKDWDEINNDKSIYRLFELKAPYILDLIRGMAETMGGRQSQAGGAKAIYDCLVKNIKDAKIIYLENLQKKTLMVAMLSLSPIWAPGYPINSMQTGGKESLILQRKAGESCWCTMP